MSNKNKNNKKVMTCKYEAMIKIGGEHIKIAISGKDLSRLVELGRKKDKIVGQDKAINFDGSPCIATAIGLSAPLIMTIETVIENK